MSLKTPLLTLAALVCLLHIGSCWPQSPSASAAQDDEHQTAASHGEISPQGGQKPKHGSLFPEDVEGLQKLAIKSYQEGNYLRFIQATIKLREQRPYEQQYLVGMVVGAALLGHTSTAYNYMHVMQQQGLSYDFNSNDDTESIRHTEAYDYLNDLLVKAGEPMGEGSVAFKLPSATVQPEAIAWDAGRGTFLVGTLDSGTLLAVTPAGEVRELLHAGNENGLQAITGLAVDDKRGRLWVSTAGVPQFAGVLPTELGRGALLEFALDTLQLLHRYDVPLDGLPHVPGRLAIDPAGDVYVIDRAVPMVFRKPAQSGKLEAYLASEKMTGFTDLAMSPAGDKLYIADAALGIVVIDTAKQALIMLAVPETLNLGGISGLMYSEGSLFVLQNGITPQRLLRLQLDAGGTQVIETKALAVALPEFDAPAFGTVEGGAVYYFASGNRPGEKRAAAPVVVMKTPVQLSQPIVPVEQRKFEADRLKNKPHTTLAPGAAPASGAEPPAEPQQDSKS
jgi:hypothetical protein